ncbi:hypothetical protein GUJ93_ZPchr0006g44167 [Zizania palustris]|uniref:WRC domain-containing protein n=1 Tax=Zizania palustris TaxID=103762 RepID=A0A8J5TGT8_ZIZPA|nr:hypothetical protein GUJ93_ZPchr0006g44167 [Zizania palustris]
MRIRKRPQTISLQHSSDPRTSTAPQTPLLQIAARSREWMHGGKIDGGRLQLLHHAHVNVDLDKKSGVARRLALPQDNGVDRSSSPGDETQRSLVNGRGGTEEKGGVTFTGGGDGSESVPVAEVGEPGSNGTAAPVASPDVVVAVKDEKTCGGSGGIGDGGGAKKRRGRPAVLMEGSRCSRVNGRGWRCSQPTLVGYALCEHHLGKGRMRSVSGSRQRGCASQLGCTEHRSMIPASSPSADEPGQRRS